MSGFSDFLASGRYRSSQRGKVSFGLSMLLLGVAAGAFVALLCAPQTGKQTRRTIRRKYEDARDVMEEFGDQASDWLDKGSEWADKAKEKVKPFTESLGR
jgi:gas vesicle protein